MWLASKTRWGIIRGTNVCLDLIITLMFHHFHIMWLSNETRLLFEYFEMANVSIKKIVFDTLFWPPP
jgi:hypothetical protein